MIIERRHMMHKNDFPAIGYEDCLTNTKTGERIRAKVVDVKFSPHECHIPNLGKWYKNDCLVTWEPMEV